MPRSGVELCWPSNREDFRRRGLSITCCAAVRKTRLPAALSTPSRSTLLNILTVTELALQPLASYCRDGRLPIDNNEAEQLIRQVALTFQRKIDSQ